MFFKDNTIEKRVMQVIRSKIAEAQNKFDETCKALEMKLELDIERLHLDHEDSLEVAADTHANSIIGKIL